MTTYTNIGGVEVAEYVNRELVLKGEPQKQWIKELVEQMK